jgi:hypothetical protein
VIEKSGKKKKEIDQYLYKIKMFFWYICSRILRSGRSSVTKKQMKIAAVWESFNNKYRSKKENKEKDKINKLL